MGAPGLPPSLWFENRNNHIWMSGVHPSSWLVGPHEQLMKSQTDVNITSQNMNSVESIVVLTEVRNQVFFSISRNTNKYLRKQWSRPLLVIIKNACFSGLKGRLKMGPWVYPVFRFLLSVKVKYSSRKDIKVLPTGGKVGGSSTTWFTAPRSLSNQPIVVETSH